MRVHLFNLLIDQAIGNAACTRPAGTRPACTHPVSTQLGPIIVPLCRVSPFSSLHFGGTPGPFLSSSYLIVSPLPCLCTSLPFPAPLYSPPYTPLPLYSSPSVLLSLCAPLPLCSSPSVLFRPFLHHHLAQPLHCCPPPRYTATRKTTGGAAPTTLMCTEPHRPDPNPPSQAGPNATCNGPILGIHASAPQCVHATAASETEFLLAFLPAAEIL